MTQSLLRYVDLFLYPYCGCDWKPRYYAHCSSFRDPERRTETTLSEYIWDIQQQQINHVINWKIIEKTSGFNPITLQCKICLSEIYHIVVNPNQANLNRRLETFSYCRHLKKYLLSKAQFYYLKGGALLLKSGRWVNLLASIHFLIQL